MFTPNSILFMAQEVEQPGLFPFPFGMHIVFAIVALIFFAYRFKTDKRPYQLIMAIAIPFSLLLWLSDSRSLYYFVGLSEGILLLAALITSIIFRKPETDEEAVEEAAEEAEEAVEEAVEEDAEEEPSDSEDDQQ